MFSSDQPTHKITFVNNTNGLSTEMAIPIGATAVDVFASELGASANPNDYKLRVRPADGGSVFTAIEGQALSAGDQLSVIPSKVEAGSAA